MSPFRAALAAVLVLAVVPAAALAARERVASTRTFNARYCELLEVRGASPDLEVSVWNTLGFNTCPQAVWRTFDPTAIAQQSGATAVVLNGPRSFLMDRASAVPAGGVRTYNGLKMRKLATIEIGDAANLVNVPYTDRQIQRDNTFVWNAGRRVYELIAPGGRTYVMQSYAQTPEHPQTLGGLPSLGRRLTLPAGWHFHSRVRRRALVLGVDAQATITRDTFENTYQLERR